MKQQAQNSPTGDYSNIDGQLLGSTQSHRRVYALKYYRAMISSLCESSDGAQAVVFLGQPSWNCLKLRMDTRRCRLSIGQARRIRRFSSAVRYTLRRVGCHTKCSEVPDIHSGRRAQDKCWRAALPNSPLHSLDDRRSVFRTSDTHFLAQRNRRSSNEDVLWWECIFRF